MNDATNTPSAIRQNAGMDDPALSSRLLAILAADAVGFSRLMSVDERATVVALDAARKVFRDHIAAHGGRIVDTAGDSVLATFITARGAVASALAVQQQLSASVADLPGDYRMRFRIGVHMGDIVEKPDGTAYGDGVNIAARLQTLAEPGGMAVSESIRTAVRGRVDAVFEDLGDQLFKNIAVPVRAYRVRPEGNSAVKPNRAVPEIDLSLPDKPSIAVLPFTNMSGDREQEYFADGIVEDIITALSRIGWLFVIARNSSFTYKDKPVDVRQVGRELGIRFVLEGSVRKAGNRVRVTGQLVEAATGNHIWADRVDGELAEIFDLQDRITESVVFAIEPRMLKLEIERTRTKRPEDLNAYDLYLRAHPEFQSYTHEGFLRAKALLEQALVIDPLFADAWTELADCLGRLLIGGWLEPLEEGKKRVCDTALRAVSIDPENGSALAMAAWALAVVGNRAERGAELAKEALRIHPNSAYVRMQSAYAFLYSGQIEVALENLSAALRFSPFDTRAYTILVGIANCHLYLRRFPEAILWAERAIESGPDFVVAHRSLTVALAHNGQIEAARRACGRLLALQPNSSLSLIRQRPFGLPWMMDLWLEGLLLAGLPE